MNSYLDTINSLIEDTCVLAVIAYVLARMPLGLRLFSRFRHGAGTYRLGLVFGIVALTEVVFPGDRYPYVTHVLVVAFSTFVAGVPVGAVCAEVLAIGVLLLQRDGTSLPTILGLASCIPVAWLSRRIPVKPLLQGALAGGLSQAAYQLIHDAMLKGVHVAPSFRHAAFSIFANGFGMMLLMVIVRDAQVRADSERHRLEAEQARAWAIRSQLASLRARMHPHFLFNTLTTIAALCARAPDRAEAATIRLGEMMRHVLRESAEEFVRLDEEITHCRIYLDIEMYRFGEKLVVEYHVDPSCSDVRVPGFSIQTLIENAVRHGVEPKIQRGRIHVTVRRYRKRVLISVDDEGVGIEPEELAKIRGAVNEPHGLQILDSQLRLTFGALSRIRIFSKIDSGTRVAFCVPAGEMKEKKRPS